MLRLLLALSLSTLAPRPAKAQEEGAADYRFKETIEVRDSLEEVMARPELSRLRVDPAEPEEATENPEWLERFLDWLARTLFGNSGEQTSSEPIVLPGVELVLYVMAGLMLIAAIAFIFKSVVSSRRENKLDAKQEEARLFRAGEAPGETDPEGYWQRAQTLGEQEQFKKAIRELLLGAMSALERRGLVRHRQGLTNRDYLRAARGVARESLGTIVTVFEHVYFGRREATHDGFRTCCREFQRGFLEGSR